MASQLKSGKLWCGMQAGLSVLKTAHGLTPHASKDDPFHSPVRPSTYLALPEGCEFSHIWPCLLCHLLIRCRCLPCVHGLYP